MQVIFSLLIISTDIFSLPWAYTTQVRTSREDRIMGRV